MYAVVTIVAPSSGLPCASSTSTVHVLFPLAGGAGSASTKRTVTTPSWALLSRPTAYACARGSLAQTGTGAAPPVPPDDAAPLSEGPDEPQPTAQAIAAAPTHGRIRN